MYSNFEQEFVILSDKSLVIPPFELEYFDTKTDKIKLIKTDKIAINIKQNKILISLYTNITISPDFQVCGINDCPTVIKTLSFMTFG